MRSTSRLLLVVLACSCFLHVPGRPPPAVARRCESLDLRHRVAQVVMSGIDGTEMSDETAELVKRHAGSVILYGSNIIDRPQLKDLISGMRREAPLRLLVAIDEEGGRVARLAPKGLVDRVRSARRLATRKSPRRVRFLGRRLGTQMRELGIDWNLAPVLDVTDAPKNSVIGNRSYSGDPDVVARYASAFARGLQAGGILTTAKHFPGHGRTVEDPHGSLPTVDASMKQLRRRDLKPYGPALPHLDAVMKGHVRYPAIDKRKPASLSRPATRLLRGDLGFDGIVSVDALWMRAIRERWSVPRAAVIALRNGVDVVGIGGYVGSQATVQKIKKAIRTGSLRRARLDQAVERVLEAKGYGARRISCLLRRG